MDGEFVSEFAKLQKETHAVAKAHGFQEIRDNPLYVPTALALIASEVSEALEWHRKGKDEDLPHELADIVIRTMDLAEALGINLAQAILDKHELNSKRDFKHGGKRY